MMKMFNQRFKVLRPAMTQNEFGEQVQELTNFAERWGEVKQERGDFYPAGTSQKWLTVYKIKSKHYPNKQISLDDIIEFKGTKFRILSLGVDEETFKYFDILKVTAVE